jgi:hypothetical protein
MPNREHGSVIHISKTVRVNGIPYQIQYAEPNAPACDHPDARMGREEGGEGEFRILPA